jgi:hypothetical protein
MQPSIILNYIECIQSELFPSLATAFTTTTKKPSTDALLYILNNDFTEYETYEHWRFTFSNSVPPGSHPVTVNMQNHIILDCLKCRNPQSKQFPSLAGFHR